MADENILPRDQNHVTTAGFENSLVAGDVRPGQIIVATGRVKVDASGGGTGTVTEIDTGAGLTGGPITTTGTISLDSKLAPLDTLGTPGQLIRVNAGATALEYFTAASGGVASVVGTSNRISVDSTDPANPIVDIAATYVGQSSITTLGTITTGVWSGTTIAVAKGGTGVTTIAAKSIWLANSADTITSVTPGAGQSIRINAGNTAWEAYTPSAGSVTSVSGTTDRITSTGGATPVIDIAATYVGQTSITTLGTIATGVWNATAIADGKIASALTGKTYNGLTITSTTGTLTIAAAKVVTVSNTLTFTGTDGSSVNFGTGGTVLYSASTIPLTVGSTTIASGTTTRILYDNAGVLGEYTITGSGTVVAMATAPTFITSITTPSVLATANDSGALGASGTAFADLFLASGGVINWAANNSNITHSTGILTVGAGEFRITSANVGTNADSVPTLSSTSTLTNKTLTSPTIQTSPVLAAATNLKFTVPSSDTTATGITTNEFNSGYSSTAIGDLVYLDSSATWQKADADASAATYSSMLGIALSVAASGAAVNVLLQGFVYAATPFPTFTIGAPIYMSATAGAVTQTAPVTTDSATRIIGYGVHADKMYFNPSNDWITHT